MRKGLVAVGATLLAVLAPVGVSSASHQEGGNQGSPRDFAVGAGTSGNMRVAFAAHGGPSPAEVTGHFRTGGSVLGAGSDDPTEFQFEGPVTCLNVQGNEARLIYPIKQGRPESMESMEIFISVQDNGKPGKDGGSKDTIGFTILPDSTPDDDPPSEQDLGCLVPNPGVPSQLEKGDITVHDSTP